MRFARQLAKTVILEKLCFNFNEEPVVMSDLQQELQFTQPTRETISLLQLSTLMKQQMDGFFSTKTFWVKAEIKDLRYNEAKKYYLLSLVEKPVSGPVFSMRATVWRSGIDSLKVFEQSAGVRLHDGMEVLVKLEVKYHLNYGITLNILSFDIGYTIGAMAMLREANLKRLVKELPGKVVIDSTGNVLTPNKALPLPAFIKRVCFIGSDTSDGYNDLVKELKNNPHGFVYEITVLPCLVQGAQAAGQMRSRLLEVSFTGKQFDMVVLGRGGGSQVDLACYDDYNLMREIALFSLPVVTAIGHERNLSGSDMVSRLSVKTPTKAGSFINDSNARSLSNLNDLRSNINRMVFSNLQLWRAEVDRRWSGVCQAATSAIEKERLSLRSLFTQCKTFDFQSTLDRGYAVAYTLEGKAIRVIGEIPEHEFILRLPDGEVIVKRATTNVTK